MSLIEISGLAKTYGDHTALRHVDMSVREGETVAIIGSSGCGKSTFLRCLNLLETPTSGKLRIGNDELAFDENRLTFGEKNSLSFRRSMAMVFQSFDLFPHMSAIRNVALAPILVGGLRKDESYERARKLLERVGLSGKSDSYPSQLSGGQAQRVAIARALAMEPRVLLFDEATSALDPELVDEVLAVIKDLASEGRTMLIVTHELSFARDVADTICFFDGGLVAEKGKPRDVLFNPQSERLTAFLKRFARSLH